MLRKITQAIEQLQSPIDRAEVKIAIAKQFNLSYKQDDALAYIEQSLQEIAVISSEEIYLINDLKCKVAEQLAKAGQQTRCESILAEALQKSQILESIEVRNDALDCVAETYATIGQYDWAVQIGLMIEDSYDRISLFASIARIAAVQHSRYEPVLNILEVIDDDLNKDYFLKEVVDVYAANNQPERIIALVPLITHFSSKAEALVAAAKGQNETIQRDQLLELLRQAEAYAFAEQDAIMQAQALRMIAEQYIELKQLPRARVLLVLSQ